MEKGFNLLGLLLVSALVSTAQIQTLDTVTGNGNTTNKSLFLYGNAKYNAANRNGQSLYYLNDSAFIESGNPSTGVLRPLNLKSKIVSISNQLDVQGNVNINLSAQQSATSAFRMTTTDGHFIIINSSLGQSNYNNIVQAGDQALIYAGTQSGSGSLCIAPWANATSGIRIDTNGNVGIGTPFPKSYKLAVEGTVGARRIKVTQQLNWADFVFQPDYQLPSLQDVENYINANQHLSGIPSAEEVQKEGIDLGEMNKLLLQKIEELTLYLIKQDKQQQKMQEQIDALQSNTKTQK